MRQGTGHRAQGRGERAQGVGRRAQERRRVPKPASPRAWLSPLTSGRVPRGGRAGGFTLIELIVVMAIIGILAAIAVPAMRDAPQRARESALKEDLFTLRSCLDQFHADRGRFPTSLDEMVSMGYLRSVPVDPMTRSKDTWVPVYEDTSGEQDERQQAGAAPGIIDFHSGSDQTALDGTTKYSDW
jgi:general secretion pathway protein G